MNQYKYRILVNKDCSNYILEARQDNCVAFDRYLYQCDDILEYLLSFLIFGFIIRILFFLTVRMSFTWKVIAEGKTPFDLDRALCTHKLENQWDYPKNIRDGYKVLNIL